MVVRVQDVMPTLARADLAKIDIEGAEWPILSDPRLHRGPAAIAVEFHERGCPGASTVESATRLLEQAGFEIVQPSRPLGPDEFPHQQGMLWALRRPG
jgi:hypothetical protein